MKSIVRILVIPVGNENRRPFFIPVGAVGAVDQERGGYTIGVLRAVVGVVPGMSVLSKVELVGECIIL